MCKPGVFRLLARQVVQSRFNAGSAEDVPEPIISEGHGLTFFGGETHVAEIP
jgi:hypothetical protein